ncbi:MAG: hypothetical protein WCC64_21995 [Aliidongia sp.]
MLPRTALIQLGKLLARDLSENGPVDDDLRDVGHALATHPQSIIDLLDLIATESRKKKVDTALVTSFSLMIGQGLEELRYAVERDLRSAIDAVAAVRAKVLSLVRDGKLEADALFLVLRQFVTAKLDLGEELQAVMASAIDHGPVPAMPGKADIDRFLHDMARQHDGDVFALQAQLAENTAVFPENQRAGIVAVVLEASDLALREAAVGWLLDSGAATRRDTAAQLHRATLSGLVSGTMLRRMITLRNWIPEADRAALDDIIRACRQKGVECAPALAPEAKQIVASGIDGSGALSLFLMVKDGRKHAAAALLLKQDIGVRDAWTRPALSKAEAEAFLFQIRSQIDTYPSDINFIRLALAHGLAVSLKSGVLPPFGLVDFAERAGLASINPEALPVADLIAQLVEDIPPARLAPASVAEVLEDTANWDMRYPFVQGWFEDDHAVGALLGGKRSTAQRRTALLLDQYLPTRRARWAEILGWAALIMKHDRTAAALWVDFALVAREILSGRPLSEIPLMVAIAAITVEAWKAGRA